MLGQHGEGSRGDYMYGSHLAALVLEGVHSLCSSSVTVFSSFQQRFKERLEGLVEGIPFEVLNQERDSVGIDPCLAAVVTGPESVGVVCLIDKGAVGFKEFLYRRPEAAG